jgi:hypothetical protein
MKILPLGKNQGWTNMETLIALFIILISFGIISIAAGQALNLSINILEKVDSVIEAKNQGIEVILETFNE